MSNVGAVLEREFVRLARSANRQEISALKQAHSHCELELESTKRRLAELERQLGRLTGRKVTPPAELPTPERQPTPVAARFSAKGLATQRRRLGLSAAQLGRILGVSQLTIYNWESGKAQPRPKKLAAIQSLRNMKKREVQAMLQ